MNSTKGTSLQTLNRALELLNLLAQSPSSMSVIDLSNQLGTNRTTLYAMLNSLLEAGYVHKDSTTGKYVIGHKSFELGQMYLKRFLFLPAAQTSAFSLSEKWNLSVYISIYIEGGNILVISDTHPASTRILHEGFKGPAHATAMGKVLLAGFDDSELEHELDKFDLHAFTPNTVVQRDALVAELQKIRQQGYSQDNEEYLIGLSCIAAPIKDVSGKTIAAISISGETGRVIENQHNLIRETIFTALTISKL